MFIIVTVYIMIILILYMCMMENCMSGVIVCIRVTVVIIKYMHVDMGV